MSLRLDGVSPADGSGICVIVDAVTEVYGLSVAQMFSKRRDSRTAEARMLCMFLVREALCLPLQEVGRIFGGRCHTTVMHAERSVRDWLECERCVRLRALRVGEFIVGRVVCAVTRELAESIVDALSVGEPIGIEINTEQMELCVA